MEGNHPVPDLTSENVALHLAVNRIECRGTQILSVEMRGLLSFQTAH